MSATQRNLSITGNLAGKSFAGVLRRGGATEENAETTLAAGSAGTLTTRTDNDTGEVTLTAGHGQVTGTYDVFWNGATPGSRRGMAGTVTVNALALDGGTGDNLPIATTAVVVDEQAVLDFDSDNATITLAVVSCQRRCGVQFQEAAGTPIKSLDLGKDADAADNEPWFWASSGDVSTPFGAAIGKVVVANGDSTGTNKITIGVLRS